MWARQFAEMAGVTVADQAAEHYYLVTDAIPDVKPDWCAWARVSGKSGGE